MRYASRGLSSDAYGCGNDEKTGTRSIVHVPNFSQGHVPSYMSPFFPAGFYFREGKYFFGNFATTVYFGSTTFPIRALPT